MFLINSRLDSFAAPPTFKFSSLKKLKSGGRPYPEVTAAVLPSSLTKVLSFTLGFSPYPPVLVCGTDTLNRSS